jgi:uncharacterized protein YjbI with pentapeptide repeats
MKTPNQLVGVTVGVLALSFASLSGVLVWRGYGLAWTGFQHKTLWDWLALLIIPIVLAVGVFFLNRAEHRGQEQRSTDRLRDEALQAYIDRMSELILMHRLLESKDGDEVRSVARARTLSVLRSLDGRRRGQVVLFLSGSKLIKGCFTAPGKHGAGMIDMASADLSEAELGRAYLSGIDLSGANLSRANLSGASLDGANLSRVTLAGAELTRLDAEWIDLTEADLTDANLRGSRFGGVYLAWANLTAAKLRGTVMGPVFGLTTEPVDFKTVNLTMAELRNADVDGLPKQRAKDAIISSLRRWLRHRVSRR